MQGKPCQPRVLHLVFESAVDIATMASENPRVRTQLIDRHAVLRKEYDEARILALLEGKKEQELERIKLLLLRPVLEELKCIINVSPNSLQAWNTSPASHHTSSTVNTALDLLVEPIVGDEMIYRSSFSLCRPPGSGLHESIIRAQRAVERNVQAPLITALLSGALSQSDYHAKLKPTQEVYEAIDKQLLHDYYANISRLEDLRASADEFLWENLHNDWLPNLEKDATFLPKFKLLLRDALLQARLDPYLTGMAVIGLGITAAFLNAAAGPVPAVATSSILAEAFRLRREEIKPYFAFYQRALKK